MISDITVLSGGMGGARFLQGLLHGIERGSLPGVSPDARVTVVANTCDDWWVHGLKVCPDLDTVMYTLGDGIDLERGWGRRAETWSAKEELAAYGVEPTWFGLGDRDIATHLVRTQMLDAGYPLSQVTTALCRRWLTPRYGDRLTLLPMTDDRVETHVAVADPGAPSGTRVVHFQEYWVRLRAEVPAETVVFVGLDRATPAPGVLDAITGADLVVLPPSNPVVSVGTILGVPGLRDAIRTTQARVVGLSPIVGASHVRGMAAQMLTSIGVEASAAGVGLNYGARSNGGVLDGWLVDQGDADQVARLEAAGLATAAVPLMMTDHDATAAMAAAAVAPGAVMAGSLSVLAPDGVPEVAPGDDLAAVLLRALEPDRVADGDVLVVTSKVVSKAEGRVVEGAREEWVERETVRLVAVRGATRIVRNRLGLTMAAAGIDASNVAAGSVVLLPEDPDASARALRRAVAERTGANVGVVVTDTAGRAWREGQTDIAIGAAGITVLESFAGRVDAHGNELAVTAPAVADEIASAVELAQGKLGGRPFAVVRGRADLVLPAGEDGPGATTLVRADGADLFGYGAREAVLRAVGGQPADRAPFGAPVGADELVAALSRAGIAGHLHAAGDVVVPGDRRAAVDIVAFAHGWSATESGTDLRLRPVSP